MTRALCVVAALAAALVPAAPGVAQPPDAPTELWAEYPLAPPVEKSGAPGVGPLLPPSPPEAAPDAGGSAPVVAWLAAAAIGLVVLLLVGRTVRPALASAVPALTPHKRARPTSPIALRPPPRRAPRDSFDEPLSQFAPAFADTPVASDEPRRFVIRRTGLARSHFAVLTDEAARGFGVEQRSRSFWRVGPSAWRERRSEDAWDELLNELRAAGWERDLTQRSDYYVLLRRAGDVDLSVRPRIDAYIYDPDDGGS